MAVDFTPLNSNSINNITTNFQRVDASFQDALSRSGVGPNQMNADLDMNSNDLLNVKILDTEVLYINGETVVPTTLGSFPPNSVGPSQIVDGSISLEKLDNSLLKEIVLEFDSVSDLLTDNTRMGYSAKEVDVVAGDIVKAEGFRYQIVASSTNLYDKTTQPNGYHLITAAGVKLIVLKDSNGLYNVNAFNVKADNTTDDTVALRMAIEFGASNGVSLGKSGTIKISGGIDYSSPNGYFKLVNPNRTEIRLTSGTYVNNAVIKISGSATKVADLNTDVSRGAITLTLASTVAASPGDIFSIYDPTNSSWLDVKDGGGVSIRPYYRKGEFFEVDSASGATYTLRNPLYDSYTAAIVDVYKINPVRGYIDGIIIKSENGSAPVHLITLDYVADFTIRDPYLRHFQYDCIEVYRSVNINVLNPDISNVGTSSDDYGIVWANVQHCKTIGGKIYSRRHPITKGGGDFVNAIVYRDVKTVSVTLKNDYNSGVTVGDFHGNGEYSEYIDCDIYGAGSLGGKNCGYTNCRFYGNMSIGSVIYGSEVKGGTLFVRDSELVCFLNPVTFNRGVIDIGGNSLVLTPQVTENCDFIFTGNTIKSTALSASTDIVLIGNNGTSAKINIDFSNNHIDVNNFEAAVRFVLSTGTAASDYIICDKNTTNLTGRYSVFPDGSYHILPVLRCQATSWSRSLTTSTSASTVSGSSQNFTWKFPRNPDASFGRYSTGAVGYIGNRIGVPYLTSMSASSATINLGSDDATNFSSVQTIVLSARVFIEEV